jgi:hypothetical protein
MLVGEKGGMTWRVPKDVEKAGSRAYWILDDVTGIRPVNTKEKCLTSGGGASEKRAQEGGGL